MESRVIFLARPPVDRFPVAIDADWFKEATPNRFVVRLLPLSRIGDGRVEIGSGLNAAEQVEVGRQQQTTLCVTSHGDVPRAGLESHLADAGSSRRWLLRPGTGRLVEDAHFENVETPLLDRTAAQDLFLPLQLSRIGKQQSLISQMSSRLLGIEASA
jgi:hypothetical protein